MGHVCFVMVLVFITVVGNRLAASECNKHPGCMCYFDDDNNGEAVQMTGSGNDQRAIGLAAATGALGTALLTGGGLALWKCLKGKGSNSGAYARPPSSQATWLDDPKDPMSPTRQSSSAAESENFGSRKSAVTNIYKHGGKIWPGSVQSPHF